MRKSNEAIEYNPRKAIGYQGYLRKVMVQEGGRICRCRMPSIWRIN